MLVQGADGLGEMETGWAHSAPQLVAGPLPRCLPLLRSDTGPRRSRLLDHLRISPGRFEDPLGLGVIRAHSAISSLDIRSSRPRCVVGYENVRHGPAAGGLDRFPVTQAQQDLWETATAGDL
jgi:hypothetical protein